jgi:hypothetical protein
MHLVYIIMNTCILFTTFATSQDYCGKHTKVYNKRGGPDNSNNYYFNPDTFAKGEDVCKVLNSQKVYRTSIIEKEITCIGDWCNSLGINNWGCKETIDKSACYHVEHIIPKTNFIKEIENCNTSIVGNYIMSYGKWNNELSNNFYDEKRIVYGSDIFYQAYKNIYYCCHNKIETNIIPKELSCIYCEESKDVDNSTIPLEINDVDNSTIPLVEINNEINSTIHPLEINNTSTPSPFSEITTNDNNQSSINSPSSSNNDNITDSDILGVVFGSVLTTCLLLSIIFGFVYFSTEKDLPILDVEDYENTGYENMDYNNVDYNNVDNDIV